MFSHALFDSKRSNDAFVVCALPFCDRKPSGCLGLRFIQYECWQQGKEFTATTPYAQQRAS